MILVCIVGSFSLESKTLYNIFLVYLFIFHTRLPIQLIGWSHCYSLIPIKTMWVFTRYIYCNLLLILQIINISRKFMHISKRIWNTNIIGLGRWWNRALNCFKFSFIKFLIIFIIIDIGIYLANIRVFGCRWIQFVITDYMHEFVSIFLFYLLIILHSPVKPLWFFLFFFLFFFNSFCIYF